MKLNPKIYRRAAELVADETINGCCAAIAEAAGRYSYEEPHQMEFEVLFKPTKKEQDELNHEAGSFVAGPLFWWRGEQERNERVLSLLFMEQIARNP